jgi:hypothetical protein
MLLDQLVDSVDLFSTKAVTALQSNGVEPELRLTVVPLYMNMRRLAPIAGIEEEPERTYSENSRHVPMLHRPGATGNRLP